ncbi:Poxvirus D5 protein [Tritrichomonas foetus]|uniref:Poxvirus D5 protein n=1 Tax=Tritrichomonas foetus TaxID=1144522 RepID=A0A1J4J9U5_9EUKA|nr:Poxvirus D5 protein [Tritrichomonas foetus]|eukprot:OHS94020.1 Poxvirus D5 protein [Tritrichomonas foetus]
MEANFIKSKNWITVLHVYRKYGNIAFAYKRVLLHSTDPQLLSIFSGYDLLIVQNNNFELLEKFFWHVRTIICDNNHELFNYTINWFSFIVQHPGTKVGSALVLRGQQGIGKNVFTDVICKLIGRYAHDNITTVEELTGQFNSCLENSMLIVLNEMMNYGEGRSSNFDALKSIITDPIIRINEKCQPRRTAQNVANIIFCSNNAVPVKITEGDRRYVVYDVSEKMKGCFDYFKELCSSFTPEFYSHLLSYFLVNDISEFNPRVIPMTEVKASMMEATTSLVKQFLMVHYS